MSNSLEAAIQKIHAIADVVCENQMYFWPGFDPLDDDPAKFFRKHKIEFDGDLFIRYPVKATFHPLTKSQIEKEERELGFTLPSDYKTLLQTFGEFHLPGTASICLNAPAAALQSTHSQWCEPDEPLCVLAISSYWQSSDGNSIGYVRAGDALGCELFEFNHELRYEGNDPVLWSKRISNSLADFVLEYLGKIGV